jgi:hypothetical protein
MKKCWWRILHGLCRRRGRCVRHPGDPCVHPVVAVLPVILLATAAAPHFRGAGRCGVRAAFNAAKVGLAPAPWMSAVTQPESAVLNGYDESRAAT